MIVVHAGKHYLRDTHRIDYNLAIIGAAPGPSDHIAAQVRIKNRGNIRALFEFAAGAGKAYCGYMRLRMRAQAGVELMWSPERSIRGLPRCALTVDWCELHDSSDGSECALRCARLWRYVAW